MSVTSIAYMRWPVGCSECVGPLKEVVKVAFEFAWSHRAANGADRGSVRAWLLGITHEKAVDVLRGLDSAGDPSQEPADLAESDVAADEFVSTRAGNREDAPALLDALAGVPPEQSRVIELAYFGGYNQSEIAEMLEVPADIVSAECERHQSTWIAFSRKATNER